MLVFDTFSETELLAAFAIFIPGGLVKGSPALGMVFVVGGFPIYAAYVSLGILLGRS